MHEFVKLWPVISQTFIIYVVLIVALRTVGRGRLGQLTVIDLVTVLLLGTCVETSMVAFNNHLDAGLASAATLLLANWLFGRVILKSKTCKRILCAEPLLLITDGILITDRLRLAGLTESQLLEAIREREHSAISEIKYAVLETDGEINVVPKDVIVLRSRISRKRDNAKPKPL